MYHPYFRGKQFELITIREMACSAARIPAARSSRIDSSSESADVSVVIAWLDLVGVGRKLRKRVLGHQNDVVAMNVAAARQHDAARRQDTDSRFLGCLTNHFDSVVTASSPCIQNDALRSGTHGAHPASSLLASEGFMSCSPTTKSGFTPR